MLQTLEVQNFAIVEKLEINFTSGLNIITGETGAGKSILLGGHRPAAGRPRCQRLCSQRGEQSYYQWSLENRQAFKGSSNSP
jgi:DNA repair protein RecN (Recombination protein N)